MKTRAFLFVIFAGVLWGTSGIFSYLLTPYGFTAWQMTALRGLVALLCLLIYASFFRCASFRVQWRELLLYLFVGLSLFGTSGCYFAAMRLTSVSTAVVLMYTAPILVMLFSVLFWKERFTKLKLLSVAVMLLGCVLVSGVIGGLRLNAIGLAVGLLSGISYASYNILTKYATKKGCPPLSITLYGALFMALIALCVCRPHLILTAVSSRPAVTLPLILLLGAVTFILPYLFYAKGLEALPAGTASSLSIVEPMSATLFSIAFLHEKPSVFSILGILLILSAVFLLSRADKQGSGHIASREGGKAEIKIDV